MNPQQKPRRATDISAEPQSRNQIAWQPAFSYKQSAIKAGLETRCRRGRPPHRPGAEERGRFFAGAKKVRS
jgi:hypothetical protein